MSEMLLGGRYRLIQPLGSGGFGETFLAEDTQFPKHPKCVVKKLKPELSASNAVWEDACRLFQREAETLAELGKNDQIPQLLAHFEENGHFFLIQELIEGHDLTQEITPGKQCSEYYVVTLLNDLLGVLDYVHQKGVIHRDLKPSNLMRRQSDGKVVVIDFGAVKTIGSQTTVNRSNTAHTVSICTPGYTPNEQYSGQPKLSSDIYAVGMIAVQALTGLLPAELPRDAKTNEIVWTDKANVSPQLSEILSRMILVDFRHRYQDASQAKTALTQMQSQSVTTAVSLPTTEVTTRIRESLPLPVSGQHSSDLQDSLKINQSPPQRKLPIRTFLVALGLGLLAGLGGAFYIVKQFFPATVVPDVAVITPDADPPLQQSEESNVGGSLQDEQLAEKKTETLDMSGDSPSSGAVGEAGPRKPISVNFSPLRDALEAGQWKNADQITRDLMLAISGRAGSFLRVEDIETIPCEQFNTMNDLWTNASNGRFGFKAQQSVWESLVGKATESENVKPSNPSLALEEFTKRMQWGLDRYGRSLEYGALTFAINAPIGYLPVKPLVASDVVNDDTRISGTSKLIPTISQRSAFCGKTDASEATVKTSNENKVNEEKN